MLNTVGTLEVIRVVTSAAITLDCLCSFVDFTSPSTVTPDSTATAITTAATTTVVAAPGASITRNHKSMFFRNKHASLAGDVTVQFFDGTTAFELFKTNLLSGEMLAFTENDGFQAFDSAGNRKTTALATGRFLGRSPLLTTASANFTTSSATRRIVVRGIGGGGGGGGVSSGVAAQAACGAGGGAGGYCEKQFDVSPSTAYAYTCGAAGAAGANTGGTGGTGGNSTFVVGGTTVTASGGVGGVGMTTGTSEIGAAGGSGGAAANGDLNSPGASGDFGYRRSGLLGFSGSGADCEFGGGGKGLVAAGAGTAGSGNGAGGGGGLVLNNSAAAIGGAGTAGAWYVEEYA